MMIASHYLDAGRKAEPREGLATTSGGPVTAFITAPTGGGATGASAAGSGR